MFILNSDLCIKLIFLITGWQLCLLRVLTPALALALVPTVQTEWTLCPSECHPPMPAHHGSGEESKVICLGVKGVSDV